MRILCDHNVAAKYIEAFERAEGITVATVADELSPEVTDEAIVRFASRDDWVVFTTDDDFFQHADVCGVLVYSQISDPSPGDVLDAVTAIEVAYDSPSDIITTVPGGWL